MRGDFAMRKNFVKLFLAAYLLIGTTGCAFTTVGEANWEIYGGVRTRQLSEEPAKIEVAWDAWIEFTDDKISEAE